MRKCPPLMQALAGAPVTRHPVTGIVSKDPKSADCIGKDCEWFEEQAQACSVKVIARNVRNVAGILSLLIKEGEEKADGEDSRSSRGGE